MEAVGASAGNDAKKLPFIWEIGGCAGTWMPWAKKPPIIWENGGCDGTWLPWAINSAGAR